MALALIAETPVVVRSLAVLDDILLTVSQVMLILNLNGAFQFFTRLCVDGG